MFYPLLAQVVSLLFDLFALAQRSQRDKDLEILLLRQMERSAVLLILQRHHPAAPRVSRWEKFALAVLVGKLAVLGRGGKTKLDEVLLLFKPDTVLRWHRDLVRRKWTFTQRRRLGRPATDPEIKELLLLLAQENLR